MGEEDSKKLTLVYFNLAGRAEAARLALHIGGIAFVDKRVGFEEFGASLKPSLPLGQLPVLQTPDDGTIAQSLAILTYAAARAGLMPTDPTLLARVIQFYGCCEDLYCVYVRLIHGKDEQKKQEEMEAMSKVTLPKWLTNLENLLQNDLKAARRAAEFTVGEAMSAADLLLYTCIKQVVLGGKIDGFDSASVSQKYPSLMKIVENVGANPKVKEWETMKH